MIRGSRKNREEIFLQNISPCLIQRVRTATKSSAIITGYPAKFRNWYLGNTSR